MFSFFYHRQFFHNLGKTPDVCPFCPADDEARNVPFRELTSHIVRKHLQFTKQSSEAPPPPSGSSTVMIKTLEKQERKKRIWNRREVTEDPLEEDADYLGRLPKWRTIIGAEDTPEEFQVRDLFTFEIKSCPQGR